jgi:adenylate cyclase
VREPILLETRTPTHVTGSTAAAEAGTLTEHTAAAGAKTMSELRSQSEVHAMPRNPDFGWASVLVTDDDAANRDILTRGLARLGCRVLQAEDGRQALALLRSEPVDLVLLDIMMPEISGFAVLEQIRGEPWLRAIPVIIISAVDDLNSVVRAFELGAEDYLPKPCHHVLLRARVGASLERQQLRAHEEAERVQSDRLLLNVLPAAVAERLKNDQGPIADSIEDATVLFADLVNFTALAERLAALELVGRLGTVFSAFDELVAAHGVEKIKTIGDAYMAVAGVPTPRPDNAEVMANLALAMQAALVQLNASHGWALQARIGMATGPLVAGVIGQQKFSYDLWGDTVNTAAHMESHGVPGRIQVTGATYQRLSSRFEFESRGPIDVKGKGMLETYFLTGVMDQRSPHRPAGHPARARSAP